MLKETVSIDEVIALLNIALEKDPNAISSLVTTYVLCNSDLAYSTEVQCGIHDEGFTVGCLGLINSFFGVQDQSNAGAIGARLHRGKVTEFLRYETMKNP